MEHKEKISFLQVLSELDKKMNIEHELLPKLEEKLQDKNDDEKEKIILDLVKGIQNNENFLIEIMKLKNIGLNKTIQRVNARIINNPDGIKKIEDKHVLLIKILLKKELLYENVSKDYITRFINFITNNTGQVYNYWNNPIHPNFQNSIQKVIFTNENVVSLLFLHILNVYLLHKKSGNEENFNTYISQVQNNLKISIASYIRIAQKVPETKNLLVHLSIIVIFTNLYGQPVQISNFGKVQISEIFQVIFQHNNLEKLFVKYLDILRELDILYDFLVTLESNQNQLNANYIVKILETILKTSLYSGELLINFCLFFSSKTPTIYEGIIKRENGKDKYWYKDLVLENLSQDKNVLHNETLEFLQFVENWQKNKELKEKVKEFIKNNINQLLKKDNIFNIYKILIENGEKFELNYTSKDIGKILIDTLLKLDEENEKFVYIFVNIDKLFKKQDLDTFKSKLFEEIIDNLEILNDYQYKILVRSKALLKIDKSQIEEIFKKLIDIRDNENSFLLFKSIVENNKRKLNEDLKKDFKEKLEDIKENVENEDIVETIDEILGIL